MLRFLVATLLLVTVSCASEPEAMNHEHHHMQDHQTESPKAPVYGEDSLFNVKTIWEDNNNNKVTLSEFKNTPVLLTMTYTSCQYSCPLTLQKLEGIEKKIKAAKYENYKIAVISFDTIRDTPKRFKEYMQSKKIDPKRYVFLRSADKSKIREIAVHLGINYKEERGGEFSHSNLITLLDKNGVIVQQINGIGGDPTDLIDKLVQMK